MLLFAVCSFPNLIKGFSCLFRYKPHYTLISVLGVYGNFSLLCFYFIVYNILLFIRLEFPYDFKWDSVTKNNNRCNIVASVDCVYIWKCHDTSESLKFKIVHVCVCMNRTLIRISIKNTIKMKLIKNCCKGHKSNRAYRRPIFC